MRDSHYTLTAGIGKEIEHYMIANTIEEAEDCFVDAKERLLERIAPRLDSAQAGTLVQAAQVCDGLVKGLRHPQWPHDPWDALRRLAVMLTEVASAR